MPPARQSLSPVLEVTGLSVTRGGTPILVGVDWRVNPGEHWVIIGANGSGKTSLLAALTGYLTPSGGQIDLLGRRYGEADWPALRRRVGLVSSSLRQLFHEDEPALEIVIGGRYAAIDLRDRPRPADLRRARQLLVQVECGPLERRTWAVLSQGERQRVLIARALMANPDLLILDEPCAGLDPVARDRFLAYVGLLARRPSPSLILVTHHVEEILPAFRRTLVLREGRVAANGPTRQILSSGTLSAVLGARVTVTRRRGRYTLRTTGRPWLAREAT